MSAPDAALLLAPAAAFLIAAASPGPATMSVAATAMAHGWGAAAALGLGLTIGLGAWGALVAAGLGALVMGSAPALFVLRVGGGLFLLYLAWTAARAAWAPAPALAAARGPASAPGRLFRRGLALNLLNPKAALAWAAVIALGAPTGAGALTALVAVCIALGLATYLGYAAAFSLPPVRGGYARARRWIDGAVAAGFAAAGLRLLSDRGTAAP